MRLFEKFEQLTDQRVVITLKGGKKIHGRLLGFFKDTEFSGSPFVLQWHVADDIDADGGFDIFGMKKGKIVNHKDIAEVFFKEDSSTMRFA